MTEHQNHDCVDRAGFITALRTVASSVCVVTTNGADGCHGATVSTFCSVSADPPTVLVCLKNGSRIANAVLSNKTFTVNVLPQDARYVADRFAGAHDNEVEDRFDGIEHSPGSVASINGATVFSCQTVQTMGSGSHVIFVGQVTALNGGVEKPLTYMDGAYHQVIPQSGMGALRN